MISGRVFAVGDSPVANATILLDGVETTTTDAEGVYYIDAMTPEKLSKLHLQA